MGCDIHLYKEKKVNGEWITADDGWCDEYDDGFVDVPWKRRFTNRDYELFGFLASGVRYESDYSFSPRRLPFNVCPEVRAISESYGADGHSHSYLYLSELKDAWTFLQTKTVTVSGMKDHVELNNLNASIKSDDETDWGLLYPYCKWSSISTYLEFSIEVPASFKLAGLKEIIQLFDNIDGDDHRIVFWFDN